MCYEQPKHFPRPPCPMTLLPCEFYQQNGHSHWPNTPPLSNDDFTHPEHDDLNDDVLSWLHRDRNYGSVYDGIIKHVEIGWTDTDSGVFMVMHDLYNILKDLDNGKTP